MAFDLVPNNRAFRVEGWHYLTEEENEAILVVDKGPNGELTFDQRSEFHFPPNVNKATQKLFGVCETTWCIFRTVTTFGDRKKNLWARRIGP
jgi:hypothetical protein